MHILCGHTHVQRELRFGKKVTWNPGSVGVPLESGGKTQFMILHGVDNSWQQEFLSLDYDFDTLIYGQCNWPEIPEECWEQAVCELL